MSKILVYQTTKTTITAKSAYAAIQFDNADNSTQIDTSLWKRVWSLKLPPKVKNFLWRSLAGCLPTKDNLLCKRVAVLSLCPVCNIETETVLHTLVTCQFAKRCWNHAEIVVDDRDCTNFSQWLSLVMEMHSSKNVQIACMLCWEMWKNRNAVVWQQKGEEFDRVVVSAKLTFNHWWSAQDKSFDNFLGFMTQADGKERWERPVEGALKVNTDAAIFSDSNKYSYSLVARDHKGELVEARSSCKQGNIDPVLAEAMGVREALSWVKNKGWYEAVVETDCLAVIQAIRCSSITLSYYGRVLEECKELLSQLKERNIALNFVKRSANQVAHYLARHSSSIADCMWKKEDTHPEFSHVLVTDLKV